jgi:putative flippase GtrA
MTRSRAPDVRTEVGTLSRFALAGAAKTVVGLAVLSAGTAILPVQIQTLAQFAAVGTYTAVQFILLRLWVFGRRA